MIKRGFRYKTLHIFLLGGWAGFFLFSCGNNAGNIPFPENFSASEQPRIVPLDLGIPKKLVWDTARTGGVRAVTRKLDLFELPSIGYDSTGFQPVKPDVNESHFDWNALPATPLDLDSLPAHSRNQGNEPRRRLGQ